MSYIDGFVIAVPNANKQAFIDHAGRFDGMFLEFGATRVVECWGDEQGHARRRHGKVHEGSAHGGGFELPLRRQAHDLRRLHARGGAGLATPSRLLA